MITSVGRGRGEGSHTSPSPSVAPATRVAACLVLVPSKDVGGHTLEEEERALDKYVPHHGGGQSAAVEPEDLSGIGEGWLSLQ